MLLSLDLIDKIATALCDFLFLLQQLLGRQDKSTSDVTFSGYAARISM